MQHSATIIPFPVTATQNSGSARLAAALQDLQKALDEQQETLREWRFALAELGIGVAGLGHSLTVYQDDLGQVVDRLDTLRDRSAALEAWADDALQG